MKLSGLIQEADGILLPIGFHRRKTTWNRMSGDYIDVIDLQASRTGDRVTLNFGVLLPAIYEMCWGRSIHGFVQEPFCTVRTRLLDSRGAELWWTADEASAPAEMMTLLQTQGLAFVNRMHSLSSMADHLLNRFRRPSPPESIYLALIRAMQGDAGACAMLRDLQRRVLGDWKLRIDEVRSRLDCNDG